MAEIGIIGAGIGGLTAGIKLAESGNRVCIFEKERRERIAHDWMDDIRFDIFEFCGIEPPPRESYYNKGKRLFISPDTKNSFHVPFSPPMVEISVERPVLAEHLVKLAEKAGCKIFFESPVSSLLVEDWKTVGFVAGGEKKRFDLVIDSSGLHSPFRAQAPSKFGIEAQPSDEGIMFAWRAFYKHKVGTPPPETDRNIYIKHLGSRGLSWCNLNQKDEVDVFVGRLGALPSVEKDEAVSDLFGRHEFFGDEVIKEGKYAEISLRSPIPMMVADGYALIGDAAYMTMPMMGSGIEASMKAAVWLTKTVNHDFLKHFTAKDLWSYQVRYYRELGARFAFIDVVKDYLLGIETETLDRLFGCGAVTDEDMGLVSTDNSSKKKPNVFELVKKAGIILKMPDVIAESAKWMSRAGALKTVAKSIPKEFDERKIKLWKKAYESLL